MPQALRDLGEAPERDASRCAASPLAQAGGPNLQVDGTERRRERPADYAKQKEYYSGKTKAHTDKNLVVRNDNTGKVAYLGPTLPHRNAAPDWLAQCV